MVHHKEIDWKRSFRLGVLSNEGLDYVFELCEDNYEGIDWSQVDHEKYFNCDWSEPSSESWTQ